MRLTLMIFRTYPRDHDSLRWQTTMIHMLTLFRVFFFFAPFNVHIILIPVSQNLADCHCYEIWNGTFLLGSRSYALRDCYFVKQCICKYFLGKIIRRHRLKWHATPPFDAYPVDCVSTLLGGACAGIFSNPSFYMESSSIMISD
jgi:hypothetical protein